jgi:hypothetical protein
LPSRNALEIKQLTIWNTGKIVKDPWPWLNDRFQQTLKTLHDTTEHLKHLLKIQNLTDGRSIKDMSREPFGAQREKLGEIWHSFPPFLPFDKSRHFYGREAMLQHIESQLKPSSKSNSVRALVIHGLGGVGKTQIALEYAHRNPSKFEVMLWIRSETVGALSESFSGIANHLGLPDAKPGTEETHEQNLILVQSWLKRESGRKHGGIFTTRFILHHVLIALCLGLRWCLIFDNCEEFRMIEKYWPTSRGSVLITAQSPQVAESADVPSLFVPTFSDCDALELFWKRLDWSLSDQKESPEAEAAEIEAAIALVNKLGGLALGIQQIAAQISKRGKASTSIQDYLKLYERNVVRLHEREFRAPGYHKNLSTVWRVAFNSLPQNAKALLGVISFMSPDVIPKMVFSPEGVEALSGELEFSTNELE